MFCDVGKGTGDLTVPHTGNGSLPSQIRNPEADSAHQWVMD